VSKPSATRRKTGFEEFVPPGRLSTWKAEDEKKKAITIGSKFIEGLKGLRK
jgi:hypothetical protein